MSTESETPERRYFPVTEVRVTTDGPSRLEGHAAMFERDSLDLGGFVERIRPGAFARSLTAATSAEKSRTIHAFWNHDSGQVLASTRSGKLTLAEDKTGLRFSLPASRLTPAQLEAVADGDMQMSFGFRVPKGGAEWQRGASGAPDIRTLVDVDLLEISLVSKPAYPDTAVAVRSYGDWKKAEPKTEDTVPPIQHFRDRLTVIEKTI